MSTIRFRPLSAAVLTVALLSGAALAQPAPLHLHTTLHRVSSASGHLIPFRSARPFEVELTLMDVPEEGQVLHVERLVVVPGAGTAWARPELGQVLLEGRMTGPIDLIIGATAAAPLPEGLAGTEVWYTTEVFVSQHGVDHSRGLSSPKLVPPHVLAADVLRHIQVVHLPIDDAGNTAKAIRFDGVNVQIVNGLGATNGDPADPLNDESPDVAVNGLGNLIVGYDELRPAPESNDRRGSHSLVIGQQHNFVSYGGLLAGSGSEATGAYCTVSGGRSNTASGNYASVSGGYSGEARGEAAAVSGGDFNVASGRYASASGGGGNEASGDCSSVSGGDSNIASGPTSAVSGGAFNSADGQSASVSGGASNAADAISSSVGGGASNVATGIWSSVTGGSGNEALGWFAVVTGGEHNLAEGSYATVAGGYTRTAAGAHDSWLGSFMTEE